MNQEKFSFSRLDTFHNCKRAYYYTYVQNNRSGDNVYSFLGSIVHSLSQGIIQQTETNETAIEKFNAAIEDAEMLDLPWISEKVKSNYIDCVSHFLENYSPTDNPTFRIEDYFEVEIGGYILRGYIDLWYRIGKNLYIVDLKTSTKFTPKDLPKKGRQLILYAIALSEKYPEYNIILQFNMLKYVLKNGRLLERNKLDLFDNYDDGIVTVPYTQETIDELKQYVIDTIKEINSIDKSHIIYWSMSHNPSEAFFCKNLCGFVDICKERLLT